MTTPATCQLKERPKYVLPPETKEPLADRCLFATLSVIVVGCIIFLAAVCGIGIATLFFGG